MYLISEKLAQMRRANIAKISLLIFLLSPAFGACARGVEKFYKGRSPASRVGLCSPTAHRASRLSSPSRIKSGINWRGSPLRVSPLRATIPNAKCRISHQHHLPAICKISICIFVGVTFRIVVIPRPIFLDAQTSHKLFHPC